MYIRSLAVVQLIEDIARYLRNYFCLLGEEAIALGIYIYLEMNIYFSFKRRIFAMYYSYCVYLHYHVE
jgi:hypothetical protein